MPRDALPEHDAQACTPDETAAALLRLCHGPLAPFVAERAELTHLLDRIATQGDSETAETAHRCARQLAALEPSVTLIGQVKAGKTSLVNAMIGAPGLLPADVNPWTSVVTSLHLGPEADHNPHAARFTFFDPEDWDRLTRRGGRVGELAGRSGAEDEAEKIRAQVEEMKAKSRRRLGRRFELLLGTHHAYGKFDPALIERYVCLGDDFLDGDAEEAGGVHQGRFADITKAADLWLPRPDMPVNLCLRDTPGVNDTFMMREQITISAIRESRLCVVVLSAHQALSTVDMALIRLITNVRAREVIVFVNRIDELPDPAAQIGEIRDSIRATLAAHHADEGIEILFGSARWATLAMTGRLAELGGEGAEAMLSYAEHALDGTDREPGPAELVWSLSGLPQLYHAIWERVLAGPAREALQSVARRAMNLAVGLAAAAEADPVRLAGRTGYPLDLATMRAEIDALEARVMAQFDAGFAAALSGAAQRLERSHRSFLDRATAALVTHLDAYGEHEPWTYDPAGLRMLLRTGYQVFQRQTRSAAETAGQAGAEGIAMIYASALGREAEEFRVQPPAIPRLPAPVLIGQTIALDLQGTWWRRWWSRRRGYKAFAPEFHALIEAETRPIVEALTGSHCAPAGATMRAALTEFFDDQRAVLEGLGTRAKAPGDSPDRDALDETVRRLGRLAA